MYTPEQLARRNASIWTTVQAVLAPIQFLAFLISLTLVVRYLLTDTGFWLATISVWIKIALLWAITVTGMIWEKEVFGHYFMAREFFWEDFGNLVAMITHNAYFVVQWLGLDARSVMLVMLAAYLTYLINCTQFVIKGIQAGRARRRAATLPGTTLVPAVDR